MYEFGRCRDCHKLLANIGDSLLGRCARCEASWQAQAFFNRAQADDRLRDYRIILPAGHCGKCGAPYTIEGGKPKPLCVCWNLPKAKAKRKAGAR